MKIGEGYLYFTENWLDRNEIWCPEDNHIYMSYICAKEYLDSNFNGSQLVKMKNNIPYMSLP